MTIFKLIELRFIVKMVIQHILIKFSDNKKTSIWFNNVDTS